MANFYGQYTGFGSGGGAAPYTLDYLVIAGGASGGCMGGGGGAGGYRNSYSSETSGGGGSSDRVSIESLLGLFIVVLLFGAYSKPKTLRHHSRKK